MTTSTGVERVDTTRNHALRILPENLCPERKQAHRELHTLFYSLPIDPLGAHHVGKDGILRSLTADRKIVAAVPLNLHQIKANLDLDEWDGKLEACYRGVDGTKVPREKWYEPDPNILPPPLEGDYLEEAMNILRENAEVLAGDVNAGAKDRERDTCPIVVKSDHDILEKADDK